MFIRSLELVALVAAYMSENLTGNVKICLNKLSIRKICVWSDSTTVLHWLEDNGEYKNLLVIG